MATVYKRKNKSSKSNWYTYFRVRGVRYRKKLNVQNKAQAMIIAQKMENDVINEKYDLLQKDKQMTLEKFSDKYIEYVKGTKRSWDRDVVSLKNILHMKINGKKLGSYELEKIKVQHIYEYQGVIHILPGKEKKKRSKLLARYVNLY